jgi:inorganic triphosphatase YgiF
MSDLGSLMTASQILQEGVNSPVQQLRKIVDTMRSGLVWYEKKYPDSDTSKRRELLQQLEIVCQSLEACEPISLMKTIRTKLAEAKKHKFDPDCACVWIPLAPVVGDILHARPAIIDLVGWYISSPYDYDHVGEANAGGFICSDTDEEGCCYGN